MPMRGASRSETVSDLEMGERQSAAVILGVGPSERTVRDAFCVGMWPHQRRLRQEMNRN